MICGLLIGSGTLFCRGGRIWTDDLVVPNDARYQAALHPVQCWCVFNCGANLKFSQEKHAPFSNKFFSLLLFFALQPSDLKIRNRFRTSIWNGSSNPHNQSTLKNQSPLIAKMICLFSLSLTFPLKQIKYLLVMQLRWINALIRNSLT